MRETRIIPIDRDRCISLACRIFDDKTEGRYEDAYTCLEEIRENFYPAAAAAYYDEFSFSGKSLHVEGNEVTCDAFGKISTNEVTGVHFYCSTSGYTGSVTGGICYQLYEEMWATAVTDAVRIMTKEELSKRGNTSRSFGPGFFGMKMNEMEKISGLVDFASVGMKAGEGGMLIPEKSCAGLFLVYREGYRESISACEFCKGSRSACFMCIEKDFENRKSIYDVLKK